MKEKMIPKRDFIYLCVILGILLLSVLSIAYWDTKYSGQSLNNAATAVSIVLAVVAIVITLVDVAGQRDSITDLKDSVKKIESTLKQAENLSEKTKTQILEVTDLKDELIDRIETSIQFQQEIKEMIEESEDKIDKDSIIKIYQEYEEEKYSSSIKRKLDKENITTIRNLIMKLYDFESEFSVDDIVYQLMSRGYTYTRNEVAIYLRVLQEKEFLKAKLDKEGVIYSIKDYQLVTV